MKGSRHQTQWAGQFGVAHEMTRRGYLVSFTMGNAPAIDLLCRSPKGQNFSLQVKSLSSKTYFLYGKNFVDGPRPDLCFAFVLIPKDDNDRPNYYILNNEQFQKMHKVTLKLQDEKVKKRGGEPYKPFSPAVYWKTLEDLGFKDNWKNLPE